MGKGKVSWSASMVFCRVRLYRVGAMHRQDVGYSYSWPSPLAINGHGSFMQKARRLLHEVEARVRTFTPGEKTGLPSVPKVGRRIIF